MAERYFKANIEKGLHLSQDKITGENLGGLLDKKNHFAGQARFVEVDPSEIKGVSVDLEGIAAVGQVVLDVGLAIYQIYQECKGNSRAAQEEYSDFGIQASKPQRVQKGLFSQREISKILSKPDNPFGQKRYKSVKKTVEITETKEELSSTQQIAQMSNQSQKEQTQVISAPEFSEVVDNTIKGYILNSEDPEIQKRLIRITFLSMMMAQEIRGLVQDCQKNNKAVSVDYQGWQQVMEKMLSEKICSGINNILQKNPGLIKENIDLIPQNSEARLLLEDKHTLPMDAFAKILSVRPEYVEVGGSFCKYCGAKLYMQGALFCSACGGKQ